MRYKPIILILLFICGLNTVLINAQDTLRTHLTYDLSTEMAVGTGDYTAFQIVSNRHHVLGTRSNTANIRGAVNIEHSMGKDFTLSGTIDVIASTHADHKTYLQQCFANITYKNFYLETGAREDKQVIRNDLLSSGSFVKGTNAKPFPQFRIGTKDFWNVPYTKGWLQIHFDGGYGRYMDSDYRKKAFNKGLSSDGSNINDKYATGIYMHQKHLYIRTNPTKRFFAMAGMEHMVQFGGKLHAYNKEGVFTSKEKPTDLKACFDVFLPLGDSNYAEHDAMEDWIFGNHVGMMTVQFGWNINNNHLLQAYVDNPFEDGSGIRKGNGWDGLWGLEYTNKLSGSQYIRGVVVEYFQTTNQSGPIHWDSRDYPEPVSSQIIDYVTGCDNYYNHLYYDSYTHFGMTPGNPLIPSPIYNKDGYSAFSDNRVKAWHVGINGEITKQFSYLIKGSYREGWGTYYSPLATKHHSLDAIIQGNYRKGPWQFSASYAFDKGNIYGNNSTFDIKIGYHGKIL